MAKRASLPLLLLAALIGSAAAYVAYRLRFPAIAAGAEPLVARHLEFSEGKRHPAGEPVGANAV